MDDLRGELGDLLFQSVFHAQMADDAGHFNFSDVARTMSDKNGRAASPCFRGRVPR